MVSVILVTFFPHAKTKWSYSSAKGLRKGYILLKLQMTVSGRKHC